MDKADRWRLGALIELELEILMATARLAEAWEVTRSLDLHDDLLLRLARASEGSLPEKAAHVYRAVVERQIGLTGRRGYEEACRLLDRLAALEPAAEHVRLRGSAAGATSRQAVAAADARPPLGGAKGR